jgi:peptide deformylase
MTYRRKKMIYPIYVYGSSVLRQVSEDITPDYPELKNFIEDMFATMYETDGVGLAAPQVGRAIRLFVVDATPFAKNDPAAYGFKRTFINARIYERSGELVPFNEGCLSVPGIHEDVMRHETIKIRYMDENFVEHDEELTGAVARVVQHEYDHLEGMVFTDHLQPLRKNLLRGKLAAMARGNFKAAYRCKIVK